MPCPYFVGDVKDKEMSVSCEQIAQEAHGRRRWEGEFPVEAQRDHPATHQALGRRNNVGKTMGKMQQKYGEMQQKSWGNPAKIWGTSSKNHGNLGEDLWLKMMGTAMAKSLRIGSEHGKMLGESSIYPAW